ncbi:MAG: hypothetical protein LC749_14935, partial [Actinobacteria bacterium]|nr:hypothetical protein [Actinomycetota bacterium]
MSHRGVERYPQGGADAMQGGRSAGPAVAGGGAGQDREGGLHVIQAQLAQHDPTEVRAEVLVDVLVVAAQRGGAGPQASGQPVHQPLPGGQQRPVWVGGMRWAQSGQGLVGLGAGAVTASPQPSPRSAG